MLCSVIIPVHNRADVLRRALESLRSQQVEDLEILVVDDGSSDDIRAVAGEFTDLPVAVIRRPARGGAAAARNTGIANARGDYVAFLDSDDEWLPEKLRRQIDYLEGRPQTGLCCTSFHVAGRDEPLPTRYLDREEYDFADLAFGCGLSPGSTLCARRALFDAVGPFDESMSRLEDWDWLLRATSRSRIGALREPLAVVHVGRWPSEEAVIAATTALARRHGAAFWRRGLRYGLRFRSGLVYERAVAAFRGGRKLKGACLYGLSMLIYPVNRLSQFHRLRRRIALERSHRMTSGRESG